MPKAKINGLTVHYQQAGSGPDLVLIHGLFSNLAFWYLSVLPALARDFRVTVYDLRGHGFSDMPRTGYTSLNMATDLHALLEYLGVDQVHIAGHSFGGAVGLHYTALHPERVSSLTLADAWIASLQSALLSRKMDRWKTLRGRLRRSGIEVPEDLPRVGYSLLRELARLERSGEARDLASGGASMLVDGWNHNSLVARRWTELIRATSAREDLNDVSGLTLERIQQVTRPCLAIYGEYSDCLPTLRGLEKRMPKCKRVIIPGVGHLHPVLMPAEFVQQLRQFVQGLDSKQGDQIATV